MEITVLVALIAALAAGLAVFFAIRRPNDESAQQLQAQTAKLAETQAELAGRLSQMAETGAAGQQALSERLQAQERAISKALDDRLGDFGRRVGETLEKSGAKTNETITNLKERLAVIDAAQKNITDLSAQMVELQDILTNRQTRGLFGEVQLQDLVSQALPPSAYSFQSVLSNGKRADCLLTLPNPPGSIAIDAKFPLEAYSALQNAEDDAAKTQAARGFSAAVLKHVNDIAGRYILPGETAESALMFLPSEAVYAELHARFPDVVEKSYRARVWIVSPTTLMATLHTIRAVLKDAHMREQAGVIQGEVHRLLEDVTRLDDRVSKLQRHFGQAEEDIRNIRISTDKVTKRSEKIEEIQLGEDDAMEEIAPAAGAAGSSGAAGNVHALKSGSGS